MFSHFERDLSCFDMCMRRTFFEAHTTRYEATIFHVVFSTHDIYNLRLLLVTNIVYYIGSLMLVMVSLCMCLMGVWNS
jgi:hypothetical protein